MLLLLMSFNILRPKYSALIGIVFLKESFGRIRFASALFIMSGVVLIRFGEGCGKW